MKLTLATLVLFVATAASARVDPQTAKAFGVAFGRNGSAILKNQGENGDNVRYTPGALVEAPFGPVLISPGEVLEGSHASSGKLAAIYMKRTPKGLMVARRFVPAMETGSFGVIVTWRANRTFGPLPMVSVDGGGTWQGYTCSWSTLLELAPDKPKEVVTVPLYYDDEGAVAEGQKATAIEGNITHIIRGRSFDVAYSGSKRFTDRYVRRGNKYVLSGATKTRMPTC